MKLLNVILSLTTALGAALCVAFFSLQYGRGLFTVLPDDIEGFFVENDWLKWWAFGLVVVSLLVKLPVIQALKKRGGENRA